jgi:hypothetical protein
VDALRVPFTCAIATFSWVFFRTPTLNDSLGIAARMFSGPVGKLVWPRWQLWAVVVVAVLALLEERWQWFERVGRAPAWVYASAMAALLFTLELIGFGDRAVPFVYFQF